MAKKQDALPWRIPHEAMRFSGYRAMREMAAYEADDSPVGYGALGMYLLSHALWLADEMQRGAFDQLNFLARDGALVKTAFDLVARSGGLSVKTGYVRVSRQAVFPLHFRGPEDLTQLPQWVQIAAHTERSIMRLLASNLKNGAADSADDVRLLTEKDISALIARCSTLWDAERAAVYRRHAQDYLQPFFEGRCATFDVGYNLRSESVIREVTGAEITAFITHTDSGVPYERGVPFRTLYGRSPYVSWVAREQFLLEDAPLCAGYDARGPVLADRNPDVNPYIRACQAQALQFVADMTEKYGAELLKMPLRPADGCAAFEEFLHCAKRRDMLAFRDSRVENAFHAGAAGEDSAFLQWRLMQTDFRAAVLGEPQLLTKIRRVCIRLMEDPASIRGKLSRK
ncbi:MAG: hypothetical protein IJZ74_10810 [Clostridia bacterium]|nr:hypothetical protein [Clostridia bacterium]